MPGSLSNADVARLLANPSAEVRAELAGKLGQEITGSDLAAGELVLAQDIVRLLARDVELAVRASLAQSLRHARHLPRDVALRMAEDVEAVALPILSDLLVLTDDDLVELVRLGSPRKQQSIAGRSVLSESVSDALIVHADEHAVAVLMANPTAQVSDASMNKAVDRFALSFLQCEFDNSGSLFLQEQQNRDSLPLLQIQRVEIVL